MFSAVRRFSSRIIQYYTPPLNLYYDFLEICRKNNTENIRLYHNKHIQNVIKGDDYNKFMGTIYNTIRDDGATQPVLTWFQLMAEEKQLLK